MRTWVVARLTPFLKPDVWSVPESWDQRARDGPVQDMAAAVIETLSNEVEIRECLRVWLRRASTARARGERELGVNE